MDYIHTYHWNVHISFVSIVVHMKRMVAHQKKIVVTLLHNAYRSDQHTINAIYCIHGLFDGDFNLAA